MKKTKFEKIEKLKKPKGGPLEKSDKTKGGTLGKNQKFFDFFIIKISEKKFPMTKKNVSTRRGSLRRVQWYQNYVSRCIITVFIAEIIVAFSAL